LAEPFAGPGRDSRAQPLIDRLPRTRARWIDLGLRVLVIALLVEGFAAQALLQHPSLLNPAVIGSDPANYYAAGQRLNLGHPLYGPLQPGDIPVPGYPSIYPAPLLSPPLLAVAWRPLALLPFDVATTAWWMLGILFTVGLALWCAARGGRTELFVLIGVLILGLPLAYLRKAADPYLGFDSPVAIGALSGNINVGLTALLALGWWATMQPAAASTGREMARSGRPARDGVGPLERIGIHRSRRGGQDSIAASALSIAAALKVTPLAGFVWVAAQGRGAAVIKGLIGLVALGLVGLIGAGLTANVDYARVALGGHVGPTSLSLPGIAKTWLHMSLGGPARYLPFVAIPVGLAATWLLRHHPRGSLAAAILTSIWGSPVVYPGNFMLLLAVAIPYPEPRRSAATALGDLVAGSSGETPDRMRGP
jgi:hypothetical protein